MKTEKLKEVLENHAKHLSGEGGARADLEGADLRRADLYGADLRGADLRGADLEGADLRRADLEGADLRRADLRGADLEGADLRGADLYGADLRGADLAEANLREANLRGAAVPMFCKWDTAVVDGAIKIGCETKTPEEWETWLAGTEEYDTPRGTLEFKRIEAVIRAYITYLNTLNQ